MTPQEIRSLVSRCLRIVITGLLLVFTGPVVHYVRADDPWFGPVDEPPRYLHNEADGSKWSTMIRDGIEEARRYWGNYGPVYVYILGHEDEKLNSDEFHQRIIDEYSQARHEREGKPLASYKRGAEEELINKALRGEAHTYTTGLVHTDPPLAELVFINPHKSGPGLYIGAIHEYTHVFQASFPRTPTWMMEGGASFFARYLGEKRGWADLHKDMAEHMTGVGQIADPKLGIEQMEDVDKVGPEIRKYYRHLAYDAGAWAFAFMIHKSESRSIADVRTKLYPAVAEHGWEAALAEFVNMDKQVFYRAFGEFLQQPREEQLALLDTLKD